MAKILYGVAGEGLGHAVRSKVVIKHLRKNNKIKVVTSNKAYSFLKRFFDVEGIGYFNIIYRNDKAANILSLLNSIIRFPLIITKSWKINSIIRDFKPDLIITDFEPFVDYFAFFKNIPVISIDNMHIITEAYNKDIPKKYFSSSLITKLIIKSFIIKSNKYIIYAFYNHKLKNKNSFLIKPILREEILNAKTTNKNHILVYQTSKTNKKLLTELQEINEKFIVYGFNKNKRINNIMLKGFSEKGFVNDLRSCKAVITNGGFTLITEALYLKKPILSIPVKKQFEQIINSIYLEQSGYGMSAEETDKESIEKFIANIPKFQNKLKTYKKYNNNEAMKKIDNTIKLLS